VSVLGEPLKDDIKQFGEAMGRPVDPKLLPAVTARLVEFRSALRELEPRLNSEVEPAISFQVEM
jgi:hypothetical protein